jgi:plastocyanin
MLRLLTALVLGFCLAACSSSSTAPSTTTTGVGISPVGISPSSLTVQTGQVVQFLVVGGYGPPVTLPGQDFAWSVAGTGCSGASCGTIDATGRYTAPATVPDPPIVTVTASSVVDSTKSLEATVTLSPPESFSINPTSVEFGNQMVNTTSAPRAVTVTNTGSTAQPVRGRVGGTPGQWENFASTNDCPTMLAVGASCTLNITFTPSATGRRGASLTVDGTFEEEGFVNLGGTGTN